MQIEIKCDACGAAVGGLTVDLFEGADADEIVCATSGYRCETHAALAAEQAALESAQQDATRDEMQALAAQLDAASTREAWEAMSDSQKNQTLAAICAAAAVAVRAEA